MKSRAVRSIGVAAMALLTVQALSVPVWAGTTRVDEDKSDNRFSFEYDAGSGSIGSQTSSERATNNPDVHFHVSVRETEDSGSGLRGLLTLRLDGNDHTIYNGWLGLHIETESGEVAFHRSKPVSIHLRPQPGQRRATLRFRLDLPSHDQYVALGNFGARD